MPLLKGRFVSPTKPIASPSPGETIYTIPYTNEQFRSKEEYEARLALYKDPVWTCQATGQIRLTHKEAWESEQAVIKMLNEEFQPYWEKPVLEIVHHSTDVLDVLTDRAWRKLHEEFHPGEPIKIMVSTPTKVIEGVIIQVDRSGTDGNVQSSNCSSPSSNKENTGQDNVVEKKSTKVDISHIVKPQASNSPMKSPKKSNFPKLLPYKYAIKLKGKDKIIADVPAGDLKRVHHVPVKELVKTFIRTYAWRGGSHQNSPWVVKEELVKKYNLTNKIADIFLSPTKMYEIGRKVLEEKKKASREQKDDKKRKRSHSEEKKKPSKKLKMSDSPKKKKPSGEHTQAKCSTPPKKSPKKSTTQDTAHKDSDSDSTEDNIPLAIIKKSPKKLTAEMLGHISVSPRKRGRPTKAEAENVRAERELLAKMKELKKKLKEKEKAEKLAKKKPKGPRKDKKEMKQMTLFDMKGKKKAGGEATPKKSPSKSQKKSPVKLPPLAQRLIKAHDKGINKAFYGQLVGRCAKELSLAQIKLLPEKVRELVLKRYKIYEERKKLEKMTPEEKEEYMRKKREDYRKKLNEMLKNRRLEKHKRFEDTDLELKPIPTPRLVETPDGLANELFGYVAMVTEFISCYRDLFTPKDDSTVINVTTDALMTSLVSDGKQSGPVANILTTLLQTLLQDGITEDYTELGLKMSEIPVNQYTASELIRLCLRRYDKNEFDSDDDSMNSELAYDDDSEMPDDLIDRLEMCEFYEMEAEEKLEILQALCHRLMGSYSVQDYMEEKQRHAAELWKRRLAEQKERNEKRKGEKKMRKEMKKKVKTKVETSKSESKESSGLTLDKFYPTAADDAAAEEDLDLASVVKRRRIMVELRRKQMEEEKLRKEKEAEESRKQKEYELFEKEFKDGIMAAKHAYRKTPLGTDRNHNRYWLFHKCTPGLFVEKGWASTHISYSVRKNEYSDSESSDSNEESVPSAGLKRGRKGVDFSGEKTVPRTGQNLWFIYDKMEDVDKLIENLHEHGIRESILKTKLQEVYKIISNSIQILNKQQPITADPVDMVNGFREELLDMETRLTVGGLGGVPNKSAWESRLKKAKTTEEFGQCLIECQANVYERFLKGIMVRKAKPSKVKFKKEEEAEVKTEKDAENDETDQIAIGVEKWKEAIASCSTFSRLHVLMGILDASIKWEKSAENAKCKICRKKGDEDRLLLCDQCNQAYHLYCLRPALTDIPVGEWFCAACAPPTKRVMRKRDENKDYRTLAGYSDSDSEAAEPEPNEQECAVCGGDEDIFPCSTCPSSFHLDCHEPPLRREPRSTWRCMQCISGVRLTKMKRAATYKRPKYKDYDSDDEDFEEKPKKSSRLKQTRIDNNHLSHVTRSQRHASKRYEDSDSEEEFNSSLRRSSRRPCTRHSYTESDSDDADFSKTGSSRTRHSASSRSSRSYESSSPSSSHHTRQRGSAPLVNGDLLAKEAWDSSRKVMMDVLKRLRSHRCAWPFMEPVDAKEVPDYYTVITNPMDLQCIENKCISEQYKHPQEFVDDIALMIKNAYIYNKPDSVVGKCTEPLEKHFIKLLKRHLPECTYRRSCSPEKPTMNGTVSSENECHEVTFEMFDHDYSSRSSRR